jgi:hypothetical protein
MSKYYELLQKWNPRVKFLITKIYT